MLSWLQRILWDEAAFKGAVTNGAQYLRAGIMLLGILLHNGVIPAGALGWWAGWIVMASSLLVKAGDRNIPLTEAVKQLSPEDRTALLEGLRNAPTKP